jgi:hypothetical protein
MCWRNWIWTVVGLMLVLGPVETSRYVAWAQKAQSHQDHQHASPHGGQMVTAGRYHLEMVVKDPQTVQVYLYDDNLKPMALPNPEATLYLRLPGNKNHTLTLKAVGSGAESAWATTTDVLHDVQTFDAALRVTLDGEARNIRFTYKDAHGDAQHKH